VADVAVVDHLGYRVGGLGGWGDKMVRVLLWKRVRREGKIRLVLGVGFGIGWYWMVGWVGFCWICDVLSRAGGLGEGEDRR
jgi:hypothetical protein